MTQKSIINEHTNVVIPPEIWLLRNEEGAYICNFIPEARPVDVFTEETANPIRYVGLCLRFFDDVRSDEFFVPLSELNNLKWEEVDGRCQYNTSRANAQRYILHHIHIQLKNVFVSKRFTMQRVGLHEFEGAKMFNAGGRLILPPDITKTFEISMTPIIQRLDIDVAKYQEPVAVNGIVELIKLSPTVGQIAFAQALTGIMRSAPASSHARFLRFPQSNS
jgi:hypothetical protein